MSPEPPLTVRRRTVAPDGLGERPDDSCTDRHPAGASAGHAAASTAVASPPPLFPPTPAEAAFSRAVRYHDDDVGALAWKAASSTRLPPPTPEQAFALRVVLRASSDGVVVTGPPGTGKTTFMLQLKFLSRRRRGCVLTTAASTSALPPGGGSVVSFRRYLYVPIASPPAPLATRAQCTAAIAERLNRPQLYPRVADGYCGLEVLVVDDVACLEAWELRFADELLRATRRRWHQPFGGVQIVLVGDLAQGPAPTSQAAATALPLRTRVAYDPRHMHAPLAAPASDGRLPTQVYSSGDSASQGLGGMPASLVPSPLYDDSSLDAFSLTGAANSYSGGGYEATPRSLISATRDPVTEAYMPSLLRATARGDLPLAQYCPTLVVLMEQQRLKSPDDADIVRELWLHGEAAPTWVFRRLAGLRSSLDPDAVAYQCEEATAAATEPGSCAAAREKEIALPLVVAASRPATVAALNSAIRRCLGEYRRAQCEAASVARGMAAATAAAQALGVTAPAAPPAATEDARANYEPRTFCFHLAVVQKASVVSADPVGKNGDPGEPPAWCYEGELVMANAPKAIKRWRARLMLSDQEFAAMRESLVYFREAMGSRLTVTDEGRGPAASSVFVKSSARQLFDLTSGLTDTTAYPALRPLLGCLPDELDKDGRSVTFTVGDRVQFTHTQCEALGMVAGATGTVVGFAGKQMFDAGTVSAAYRLFRKDHDARNGDVFDKFLEQHIRYVSEASSGRNCNPYARGPPLVRLDGKLHGPFAVLPTLLYHTPLGETTVTRPGGGGGRDRNGETTATTVHLQWRPALLCLPLRVIDRVRTTRSLRGETLPDTTRLHVCLERRASGGDALLALTRSRALENVSWESVSDSLADHCRLAPGVRVLHRLLDASRTAHSPDKAAALATDVLLQLWKEHIAGQDDGSNGLTF